MSSTLTLVPPKGGNSQVKVEEEREEVLDRGLLAEQGREAADLRAERGADVLRRVGRLVAHAGHEAREDDLAVDERGEACAPS